MKYQQRVSERVIMEIGEWIRPALEELGIDSVAVPRLLTSMMQKPLQLDAGEMHELQALKELIRGALAATERGGAGDPRHQQSIAALSASDELKCVSVVDVLLNELGKETASNNGSGLLLKCVRLAYDLYQRVRAIERESDDGAVVETAAAVAATATIVVLPSALSASPSSGGVGGDGGSEAARTASAASSSLSPPAASSPLPEKCAAMAMRYYRTFPSLSGDVMTADAEECLRAAAAAAGAVGDADTSSASPASSDGDDNNNNNGGAVGGGARKKEGRAGRRSRRSRSNKERSMSAASSDSSASSPEAINEQPPSSRRHRAALRAANDEQRLAAAAEEALVPLQQQYGTLRRNQRHEDLWDGPDVVDWTPGHDPIAEERERIANAAAAALLAAEPHSELCDWSHCSDSTESIDGAEILWADAGEFADDWEPATGDPIAADRDSERIEQVLQIVCDDALARDGEQALNLRTRTLRLFERYSSSSTTTPIYSTAAASASAHDEPWTSRVRLMFEPYHRALDAIVDIHDSRELLAKLTGPIDELVPALLAMHRDAKATAIHRADPAMSTGIVLAQSLLVCAQHASDWVKKPQRMMDAYRTLHAVEYWDRVYNAIELQKGGQWALLAEQMLQDDEKTVAPMPPPTNAYANAMSAKADDCYWLYETSMIARMRTDYTVATITKNASGWMADSGTNADDDAPLLCQVYATASERSQPAAVVAARTPDPAHMPPSDDQLRHEALAAADLSEHTAAAAAVAWSREEETLLPRGEADDWPAGRYAQIPGQTERNAMRQMEMHEHRRAHYRTLDGTQPLPYRGGRTNTDCELAAGVSQLSAETPNRSAIELHELLRLAASEPAALQHAADDFPLVFDADAETDTEDVDGATMLSQIAQWERREMFWRENPNVLQLMDNHGANGLQVYRESVHAWERQRLQLARVEQQRRNSANSRPSIGQKLQQQQQQRQRLLRLRRQRNANKTRRPVWRAGRQQPALPHQYAWLRGLLLSVEHVAPVRELLVVATTQAAENAPGRVAEQRTRTFESVEELRDVQREVYLMQQFAGNQLAVHDNAPEVAVEIVDEREPERPDADAVALSDDEPDIEADRAAMRDQMLQLAEQEHEQARRAELYMQGYAYQMELMLREQELQLLQQQQQQRQIDAGYGGYQTLPAEAVPLMPQTLHNHSDEGSNFARMPQPIAETRTRGALASAIAMSIRDRYLSQNVQPSQQPQLQAQPQPQPQPPHDHYQNIVELDRTHFVPIRDGYPDGHTFQIDASVPVIRYQRLADGTFGHEHNRFMRYVQQLSSDEDGTVTSAQRRPTSADGAVGGYDDDAAPLFCPQLANGAEFQLMFRLRAADKHDKGCQADADSFSDAAAVVLPMGTPNVAAAGEVLVLVDDDPIDLSLIDGDEVDEELMSLHRRWQIEQAAQQDLQTAAAEAGAPVAIARASEVVACGAGAGAAIVAGRGASLTYEQQQELRLRFHDQPNVVNVAAAPAAAPEAAVPLQPSASRAAEAAAAAPPQAWTGPEACRNGRQHSLWHACRSCQNNRDIGTTALRAAIHVAREQRSRYEAELQQERTAAASADAEHRRRIVELLEAQDADERARLYEQFVTRLLREIRDETERELAPAAAAADDEDNRKKESNADDGDAANVGNARRDDADDGDDYNGGCNNNNGGASGGSGSGTDGDDGSSGGRNAGSDEDGGARDDNGNGNGNGHETGTTGAANDSESSDDGGGSGGSDNGRAEANEQQRPPASDDGASSCASDGTDDTINCDDGTNSQPVERNADPAAASTDDDEDSDENDDDVDSSASDATSDSDTAANASHRNRDHHPAVALVAQNCAAAKIADDEYAVIDDSAVRSFCDVNGNQFFGRANWLISDAPKAKSTAFWCNAPAWPAFMLHGAAKQRRNVKATANEDDDAEEEEDSMSSSASTSSGRRRGNLPEH